MFVSFQMKGCFPLRRRISKTKTKHVTLVQESQFKLAHGNSSSGIHQRSTSIHLNDSALNHTLELSETKKSAKLPKLTQRVSNRILPGTQFNA